MASSKLTARPLVPVFVRAAMLGSLAATPLSCGDDGDTSDSANSTDIAPTAGPCAHDGSESPECMSTGLVDDGGDTTATTATTEMTSTSGTPTTTDQAPTAGPCVHADGSQLPECQDGSGTAATDASSGSDSGDGSGSGSGSTSG